MPSEGEEKGKRSEQSNRGGRTSRAAALVSTDGSRHNNAALLLPSGLQASQHSHVQREARKEAKMQLPWDNAAHTAVSWMELQGPVQTRAMVKPQGGKTVNTAGYEQAKAIFTLSREKEV